MSRKIKTITRAEKALWKRYYLFLDDLKLFNQGLKSGQLTKEDHRRLTERTEASMVEISNAVDILRKPGMLEKVIQPMGSYKTNRKG